MHRRRATRSAVAALLVAGACAALPASSASDFTITFSFKGYANNVRVRPPLIGAYQLGVARTRGSGTLSSGGLDSYIVTRNYPKDPRYPDTFMQAHVLGYSYHQAAHGVYTKLNLTIEVTATDAPQCAVGDRALLTLYESSRKLSNGERSDYITYGHWHGACPGFVQGWTNADGGSRTSPHYGGPPHGGQWAIVHISP